MHCYKWSTGETTSQINAETAGIYIVKIATPNFCILYDTITITTDTLPDVTPDFLGDNINWCENLDTSVILQAPDGFANYWWSTGETTRKIETDTAGVYWVIAATANGCSIVDTLVITLDTLPDMATDFLGDNISWCENLDTSVILKAPADMLQYLWSTNDTIQEIEVGAGIYWGTITAHNLCVFSDTITISINTLPDVAPDFLGNNHTWCEGLDTFVILVAPDNFQSYFWNTNDTTQEVEANSAGVYWVRITAHNLCVMSDTVVISFDTVPNTPIIFKDNDTLKTNAIADYYQWFRNEFPIGSNQNYLLVSDTGIYHLQITNGYGCSASSDTLHISADADTSTDNVGTILFNGIKIYPNPFINKIEIQDKDERISRISVHTVNGQKIHLGQAKNIDTSMWSDGMYQIIITLNEGQIRSYKLIKQSP